MASPTNCAMRCRVTFAVIGIVVGSSVFVTFGALFANWDVAIWGLASGVFAAMALGIHVTYLVDKWTERPRLLPMLMIVGCFGQLAAVVVTAVYLTLAITQHQPVTASGKGYYVAAVWSAMTWKWAFLLFFYSRKYRGLLTSLSIQSDDQEDARDRRGGSVSSNVPYGRIDDLDA